MARIVGYIATSLDGFIARPDGGLDWLFKYNDMDLGEHAYTRFITGISTIVMGRATYDFLAAEETPWPYDGKRCIVVTSRPLPDPKGKLEIWSDGVDSLIANLRAAEGTAWMVGGGQLQMAFMQRQALDEIEIYVMPEIIGAGIALFPPTGFEATPTLISAKPLDAGCVRLHYRLD